MKNRLALYTIILLLAFVACKKKSEPLPTAMTFVLDKDSLWTTTNVTTDNQNTGLVFIRGTSKDGTETLDIAISGFKADKGTFMVDYRGPGGNITGNTGMYKKGVNTIMASTGKIVITSVTDQVINGTFDFFYLQTNFKGAFTAPAK